METGGGRSPRPLHRSTLRQRQSCSPHRQPQTSGRDGEDGGGPPPLYPARAPPASHTHPLAACAAAPPPRSSPSDPPAAAPPHTHGGHDSTCHIAGHPRGRGAPRCPPPAQGWLGGGGRGPAAPLSPSGAHPTSLILPLAAYAAVCPPLPAAYAAATPPPSPPPAPARRQRPRQQRRQSMAPTRTARAGGERLPEKGGREGSLGCYLGRRRIPHPLTPFDHPPLTPGPQTAAYACL